MAAAHDRITRKLVAMTAAASAIVVAVALGAAAFCLSSQPADELRLQVLALNETRTDMASLAAEAEDAAIGEGNGKALVEEADRALADAQQSLRQAAQMRQTTTVGALALLAAIAIICIIACAVYLYRAIVKPFKALEQFAQQVALGNLDAPLQYERTNPFGPFTWAFDHMRVELARARRAQAAADEAYKTALASLSHDLRTPMASVRAYAEALDMGLARTEEERREYEHTIMRKCDEAADLVEDLFEQALADMERITVTCESVAIAPLLLTCARTFSDDGSVTCPRADATTLFLDPKRLSQVIGNLLANAQKYAPGAAVQIEGAATPNAYKVTVRDFGPGVAPEDLPFLTERFFRGANAADSAGAGLGLYIVEHLTQRMGGSLRVENAHPGLRVTLTFPLQP